MHMKFSAGFTLVELIVSVGLASIVMISLLGFFVVFINQQARLQDERIALETVRFLFTDLSRELYFGYNYTCGARETDDSDNTICNCLAFSDQLGRRVKVRHNAKDRRVEQKIKSLDSNPDVCDSSEKGWVPLTNKAVAVTRLIFEFEDSEKTQPRVKLYIAATYILDGEVKNISFKTQVTRRILEPSGDILSNFTVNPSAGTGSDSPVYYFAYAQRLNDDGEYVFVCQSESGAVYPGDDNPCEIGTKLVAAEFTSDGLYMLGSNGLLFFIPTETVNKALQASGKVGSSNAKYRLSSDVQDKVKRVVGDDPDTKVCRFCDNDPHSITSIHPANEYLYARAENGALYRVSDFTAERIVNGGISRNTVQNIDISDDRIFVSFRDTAGKRVIRLFSGDPSISAGNIFGGCTEFSYVPDNTSENRCRQLRPDPDLTNAKSVEPDEVLAIPLSFFERLQIINDTVSLWYREDNKRYILSIGADSSKVKKRSDQLAEGSMLAYGNGLTKYTSICDGGNALCVVDDIINDDVVETIQVDGDANLTDHAHIRRYPIGITTAERLMYFSGVSNTDSSEEVLVYNQTGDSATHRVLCGAIVVNDEQQVAFSYMSDKSKSGDLIALVGRALDSSDDYVSEVYILEPTTIGKKQFEGGSSSERNLLCGGTDHIERYHLPDDAGPRLDLLRFRGIKLVEKKPTS